MTAFLTNLESSRARERDDIPSFRERTNQLLNEHQAAAFLNVAVKTLRNWRCRGDGPAFVRLGGKIIRYREVDLKNFVERAVRTSTSNGEL